MLSMISQLGTLFRSSSLRGNSSYVKTFFESKLALVSLYRPAPQQRFFHNSKLHNRVDFLPPIRDFQSHFLTNGQPPKNHSKEDLLVEALYSTFAFSYNLALNMKENFERAPIRLKKDLNFVICMQNLSQLKNEVGFDLKDIKKLPLLNEKIFETETLNVFKFPKAVLDILSGPSSPMKEKVSDEMRRLYGFELETFAPFFQKNPILLERLIQEKILKFRQLSLHFFPSKETFIEFAKKYPLVGHSFFHKNPGSTKLFTSDEILSIAKVHENPYAFAPFFTFDEQSLEKLDQYAECSNSSAAKEELLKNKKAKNTASFGGGIFKIFMFTNILLMGLSKKSTTPQPGRMERAYSTIERDLFFSLHS
jgi:hypothetical protein